MRAIITLALVSSAMNAIITRAAVSNALNANPSAMKRVNAPSAMSKQMPHETIHQKANKNKKSKALQRRCYFLFPMQ